MMNDQSKVSFNVGFKNRDKTKEVFSCNIQKKEKKIMN